MNQNSEQIARDKIDQMLVDAGWLVQSKNKVNLSADIGVALRETNTESGSADYILFVNSKAIGVIEVKKETEVYRLTVVEEQTARYSKEAIKIGKFKLENEKPFVYESTGTITLFSNYRDPKPRGRLDDLGYTPFDSQEDKGEMLQFFGNGMNDILKELNEVMTA